MGEYKYPFCTECESDQHATEGHEAFVAESNREAMGVLHQKASCILRAIAEIDALADVHRPKTYAYLDLPADRWGGIKRATDEARDNLGTALGHLAGLLVLNGATVEVPKVTP